MMNMTYDEFKKLKQYFYNNLHEELYDRDNGCPSEGLCELVEEWYNVRDEYKNVDVYIEELIKIGFDS
jgi:hypothetical protein